MAQKLNVPRWKRVEPYWYLIAPVLLALAGLFGYHLATGVTPGAVAFTVPLLELSVYWYGILITGGIALGAYVTARLAQQRAEETFQAQVPAAVQKRPLADLSLPDELQSALTSRGVHTWDKLLWLWGLDPRTLELPAPELETVHRRLVAQPEIETTWLENAPWRAWNPEHVWNGIFICLLLGIIGARLYHVLTPSPSMAAVGIHSPLDYFRHPFQLFNLRSGGLGIYGGLAGGALGLWIYTYRQRISMLAWADLAVVGVALGQAIGRWGNFLNQELYGRPTDVFWAIHVEPAHRLPDYANFSHFHPAFLYESLWSLLTFLLLLILARRYRHRLLVGELTALYLICYAIGRILLETIRLDSRIITIGDFNLQLAVATLVSLSLALAVALAVAGRRWRQRAA